MQQKRLWWYNGALNIFILNIQVGPDLVTFLKGYVHHQPTLPLTQQLVKMPLTAHPEALRCYGCSCLKTLKACGLVSHALANDIVVFNQAQSEY